MSELLETIVRDLYDCTKSVTLRQKWVGFQSRATGWSAVNWQPMREHAVLYVIDNGELQVGYPGGVRRVGPGQVLLVCPGVPLQVQTSRPIQFREIWLRTESMPSLEAQAPLGCQAPVELPGLIDHFANEIISNPEGPFPLLRPRLLLIFSLVRASLSRAQEQAGRVLTVNQRVRLLRWVREHVGQPPTPASLAAYLRLSPDYFSRLFRRTFNQSCRDWLIAERIQTARRLLDEDNLSVPEAMARTGFRDRAHFSRTMKRLTGLTPGGRPGWRRSVG